MALTQVSLDGSYEGGLSPLTLYGTLNVSTARIPRKKRGKGNAHLRKDRVTCRGYAETSEGEALAKEGIASVRVTNMYDDTIDDTRSVHSFRKGGERARTKKVTEAARQPEAARLASIREGEIYS